MTQQTKTPSKKDAWIEAARPRTLPLALASIGMGAFLAASHGRFALLIALFCALTTIFLQILSNFANDYGDTVHGADSDQRAGPQRVTQRGLVTPAEMRQAMVITAVLAMISGVVLVKVSPRLVAPCSLGLSIGVNCKSLEFL